MKMLYSFATLLLTLSAMAQPMSNTNELKTASSGEESIVLITPPARFSFLPNMDAYFDAQENVYIFQQNGQWVKAKEIPSGYRGYSIYNGTRVELTEYNGTQPFTLLKDHQKQYPKKYSSRRQAPKVDKNNLVLN